MFITLEGIEGCGKTTQQQLIIAYLESKGLSCCATKEPGGTHVGLHLREFMLDPKTVLTSSYTELLLFYADRVEHIAQVVKPALAEGKIVVCDRYHDSTLAYQVGGREVDIKYINALNTMTPLRPALTLLLDIPVEEGLARAKRRRSLDRFEQETLSFHNRVRNAYLELAEQEPDRVCKIDVAGKDEESVFALIRPELDAVFEFA